jgi:PEP-CTERM motif
MTAFSRVAVPVAAALLAAPISAAQATVIEWGYEVTSVFTAASPTGGGAGFVFGPDEISWGDPGGSTAIGGGRSAITINDSPAAGTVFTNGGPGMGNTYSHTNNGVSLDFPLLNSATLELSVALSALDPALGDLAPFDLSFGIDFIETDNDPDGGICADGSAVGSFGPGCVDIFVITLGDVSFDFEFEGESYIFALFDEDGEFGTLSNEACAAAGVGSGCIGFLTQEGVVNSATFAFTIAQRAIPEPQVLALFGLGLLGLGLARRRA